MNYAIILAAGSSQRYGKNKLIERVNGMPIWQRSVQLFLEHKLIDQVIVVCGEGIFVNDPSIISVNGGPTRLDSLKSGLKKIKKLSAQDIVVVHNAANPLATKKEVSRVIRLAQKFGAAGVGDWVKDTLKQVNNHKQITKTLDRKNIAAMQTPQALRGDICEKGLQTIEEQKLHKQITDELCIAEYAGIKAQLIKKSPLNIKITTEDDFRYIKYLLNDIPQEFLAGVGEDSHQFDTAQKGLSLGGICFDEYPKFQANSDGDVILHALINAISSALGMGSLSTFADQMCQQGVTDSKRYLEVILEKMHDRHFLINNISVSLECSQPKIEPILPQIKQSLSDLTDVSKDKIGITATSGEKMNEYGNGKGIKCTVIVSLVR